MSDINKKFHEFALQSGLFRGRRDWYFCYLKAEKIAHVLVLLSNSVSGEGAAALRELARSASKLPESIVRFASSELPQESVLADIFAMLSAIRFASAEGNLNAGNTPLLIEEYERIAEKLGTSGHPSPFVSSEDFSTPPLPEQKNVISASARLTPPSATISIKDTRRQPNKGHLSSGDTNSKGQIESPDSKQKQNRLLEILEVVRRLKSASIKDISIVVKNYSEKTIQRELSALIGQGLVRKEGERRWSVYIPISGI